MQGGRCGVIHPTGVAGCPVAADVGPAPIPRALLAGWCLTTGGVPAAESDGVRRPPLVTVLPLGWWGGDRLGERSRFVRAAGSRGERGVGASSACLCRCRCGGGLRADCRWPLSHG